MDPPGNWVFLDTALLARAIGTVVFLGIPWVAVTGSLAYDEMAMLLCLGGATLAWIAQRQSPGFRLAAVVGLLLGAEAVAGLLIVGTISGVLLATVLNNSGGAWDNAKKFIESGGLKDRRGKVLGKGSAAHAAAVVGDTVGDPFKDTAGPSLHVLVKLLATVTLVLAPLFVGS